MFVVFPMSWSECSPPVAGTGSAYYFEPGQISGINRLINRMTECVKE
jgi:hypothetical protein